MLEQYCFGQNSCLKKHSGTATFEYQCYTSSLSTLHVHVESVCLKHMHSMKFMLQGLDEGGVYTTKWKSMHTVAVRDI